MKGSEAFTDSEALSGFTDFFLEIHDDVLPHRMAAFGMSLQPVTYGLPLSSQVILVVPRYVISNESTTAVAVRQCLVQVLHFCSDKYCCCMIAVSFATHDYGYHLTRMT